MISELDKPFGTLNAETEGDGAAAKYSRPSALMPWLVAAAMRW
jgi:hypothetical protein